MPYNTLEEIAAKLGGESSSGNSDNDIMSITFTEVYDEQTGTYNITADKSYSDLYLYVQEHNKISVTRVFDGEASSPVISNFCGVLSTSGMGGIGILFCPANGYELDFHFNDNQCLRYYTVYSVYPNHENEWTRNETSLFQSFYLDD